MHIGFFMEIQSCSIRNDWSIDELEQIYSRPLFELVGIAHQCHLRFHPLEKYKYASLCQLKQEAVPKIAPIVLSLHPTKQGLQQNLS